MKIDQRRLPGVFEITGSPIQDARGHFKRLYDEALFRGTGLNTSWAQESESHTARKHTLRGIHVSLPPALECKTITAIRGATAWVVVDLRRDSPAFGQWDRTEVSAERHNTLYAPPGFAHGCVSLTDDCVLLLRAAPAWSEQHGTGIVWNDPDLAIDWGLGGASPFVSDRDRQYPSFQEFRQTHGGV
jgi:dTDP-4-dehydrorhamnose 3,5-epimerase